MSADLDALKKGLYDKYAANGTLTTALTGGLHWLKGEQSPTYPYATYQIVTNRNELTFVETSEVSLIQFSIFDRDLDNPTGNATIDDVFDKLVTCFDRATLTVASNNFISMIRELDHEFVNEDDTLQHTVDYRVRIQKDR